MLFFCRYLSLVKAVCMEIFFFICLGLIAFTYFGYPIILTLVTIGRKEPDHTCTDPKERVTFIISAHNERDFIGKKIRNSLELDYPSDLLEIVVASDGSTDGTQDVVRGFSDQGVKLVDIPAHVGKTAAQNLAVKESHGDILVFSDANALYDSNAIRELVRLFSDDSVGCVCGELSYRDNSSSVGKSESAYWRYEQFCKKRESLLGSLLGVNGAIYAVKRTCFVDLDSRVISDFILPMEIYAQGKKILYTSRAVAVEDPSVSFGNEFRRKKRIIVRSLFGLSRNLRFLNTFKFGFFSFELWSHKLIRWFVPFLLIGMAVSNLALLNNLFFQVTGVIQAVFYLLAVIGAVGGESVRSLFIVYIPYYFSMINIAAFLAFIEFMKGERYDRWTTARN